MSLRKEPKFGYLLLGILLFLVVGPVADKFLGAAEGVVLMTAYTALLIIGLWSLQENRLIFWTGLVLAASSIVCSLINFFIESNIFIGVGLLIYLAFLLLNIYIATEHLMAPNEVTVNKIIGGTCVYFLLGMTWSILYVIAVWLDPNSFTGSNLAAETQIYWDMTYFSFVTLTTLGYGDILPVGPLAKALAYTEAVIGQIYVAVLIGALVATYTGYRVRNK